MLQGKASRVTISEGNPLGVRRSRSPGGSWIWEESRFDWGVTCGKRRTETPKFLSRKPSVPRKAYCSSRTNGLLHIMTSDMIEYRK
jgi:hypothetical protein